MCQFSKKIHSPEGAKYARQDRSRGRGRGGSSLHPRNFEIWNKFRFKSGILLTKMNSCQRNLQFPSIVDHSKIMYCYLEWCKGTKSYFCSAKINEQNISLFFIKIDRSKMNRNAPMTLPEIGLLDCFLVSKRSASVKYTTVLEWN